MNQYGPPQSPGPNLRHSSLGIAGFIVALCGFLLGGIPFVGYIGMVGLVLCIVDMQRSGTSGMPQRKRGFTIAGIVLGILATAGAITWTVFVIWFQQATKKGSCPHVYAWNGERYELDADLASGALYKGAERDDMDRLESLVPSRDAAGDRYRVRIQNDLEEVDNVDRLALLVVDAPPDLEILPTQDGQLVGVRDARAPLGTSKASTATKGDPREVTTFTFARPPGATREAMLILRGRSTPFAERAFVAYMAKMGSGVRPLMEMRADSAEGCACYQKYLAEEVERMGLPIWVSTDAGRTVVQPIGPAIQRTQAVRIAIPEAGEVRVRLETTPRFWEIDAVTLAPIATDALTVQELSPVGDDDVAQRLTHTDERRVVLSQGESVDVAFVVPPDAPGRKRTVVAKLRGYYDLDIGGQKGVNVAQMVAHRAGWVSLPRFAADLERSK